MWGTRWDSVCKLTDPVKRASLIANSSSRLWIYCAPGGKTELDVIADPSQDLSNKNFQTEYVTAGGTNASFNFPPSGNHSWRYQGSQLVALKSDLISTING